MCAGRKYFEGLTKTKISTFVANWKKREPPNFVPGLGIDQDLVTIDGDFHRMAATAQDYLNLYVLVYFQFPQQGNWKIPEFRVMASR